MKWAVSGGLLLLAALLLSARAPAYSVPLRRPLYSIASQVGPWSGVGSERLRPELREILGGDEDLVRRYRGADGSVISTLTVFWSRQGQDAMVHDPETCLPGGGWTLLESGAVEISPGVFAQRYLAQRDRTRVLFYTWYVSAGSVQGTTWAHRLEFGRSFFTGRSEGAMVRVLVSVDESAVAEREDSLLQFSRLWMKAVEEVLPK